jgi:hypothetical protein
LRVYLDSWRGDETMESTLHSGKRPPATTLVSGGSKMESKWKGERFENLGYDLESGAGITVTREVDTKEEYTDSQHANGKKVSIEVVESPPISPISQALTRRSTNGSWRPLRIHDATEERRLGSFSASGLLDNDRNLEIHRSTEDGHLSVPETQQNRRPSSYPASGVSDVDGRNSRKGSAVSKRNSAG